MKNFLNKYKTFGFYLLSSVVGNTVLYLFLNWNEFQIRNVAVTAFTSFIAMVIGCIIVKVLKTIHEMDKASYEYRKTHPVKDEPW